MGGSLTWGLLLKSIFTNIQQSNIKISTLFSTLIFLAFPFSFLYLLEHKLRRPVLGGCARILVRISEDQNPLEFVSTRSPEKILSLMILSENKQKTMKTQFSDVSIIKEILQQFFLNLYNFYFVSFVALIAKIRKTA